MSIPRSCHNFVSFLPYMHESMLFLNFHSKKLSFKTSSMWAWIPTLYKYDWAQTSINEMMSLLCRASSVYHIKWVHLRYPVIIITQYCPSSPTSIMLWMESPITSTSWQGVLKTASQPTSAFMLATTWRHHAFCQIYYITVMKCQQNHHVITNPWSKGMLIWTSSNSLHGSGTEMLVRSL